MRIAFFVPTCTTENSHGRYVTELAKRLGSSNDVTVYAGAFGSSLESLVRRRLLPVPNRPAVVRLATLWSAAAVLARRSRFDIVHAQGADAAIGDVVTAHCCNAAMRSTAVPGTTLARRLNYAIGVAAERYCMRRRSARRVIAVSERVKGEIERHYGVGGTKVTVVPLGVDAEAFHPRNRTTLRRAARAGLRLAPDDFVVAFMGGDYRLKGLIPLLEAARSAGAGIRVLAIGVRPTAELDGPWASSVTLVEPTSDVAPYYAAADCFALPTRYDTFSLATLEAMASGLPVIVSRVAGVSEHLRDGVDALLLEDPGDVRTLATHLGRLAADRALGARLGATARATAERLSWERVVDRTLDVYRQAIGTGR